MAQSMFGNMYDARKTDMEANRKAAVDAASLGGYRTMAAVAGEMGGMLGGGIAGSMGALQPAQAKHAAIQELMGEFPDPTTYNEYMTIAGRLSSQGYLDEANHFNELAKNASLSESKIAKANTPSDDTYKEAGNLMFSHFDTPDMQKELFKIQFPNLDAEALEEASNKKGAAATRLRRLKSATTSFTNYIKTNPKYKDKASLNALLGNSDELMDEFKIFAGTRSNEHFKSLSSLLITKKPTQGFTKTTTDGGTGTGGNIDDAGGTTTSIGIDNWIAEQNPNASQFERDTIKNNFTARVDNIGVMLDPDADSAYSTVGRVPGVDATFGNLSDISVSAANTITRAWGDITDYFAGDGAEASQKRAEFKEASDWFISSAGGHRYFALHPERFEEASASPEAALEFYRNLSSDDKGSDISIMNAVGL
jgi:hypothetical protein